MNRTERIAWLKCNFKLHYELKQLTENDYKSFLEYSMHYKLNITLIEFLND